MGQASDRFLDRLARVVATMPEAVAVLERGVIATTYADLWDRSARLGAALRSRGLGRESIVGLAVEKSAGWVVGVLGSWWAGAAYLPLDPASPLDRLESLVRRSGMAAVVAGPGLASFFERLGLPVISPDRLADEPMLAPVRSDLNDLAYVIFTSGSTGRPKGVMITHRGIVPLIDAQTPAFGLRPGCRALWLLSPVFDASLSDVGTALLSGSTLCIEAPETLGSIDGLLEILERRGITHLDLPPSLLRLLDPSSLPVTIETLILGGEPSPPEVVRRFAARFRVINVYGPTEATVCSSLCTCPSGSWNEPLLGEPIAGTSYHVFDDQLEPGGAGELWIAGPGLARGYLDDPELTLAKFVERDGLRLYRTGDRVMIRPDGGHVFLGRVDRQVKVRGLLIEPEEVEARLLEHPDVIDAAVVKRAVAESRSDREGLVGFVVLADRTVPPTFEVLRGWLARTLPRWMIPQRLVFLDELPRLATGKVDLAALASSPLDRDGSRQSQAAPGQAAETLAAIWADVLGVDSVSLTRSFFDQGGDSLSLMKVVARARALGLFIVPQWLGSSRGTIAAIVERLNQTENHASLLESEADAVASGAMPASELRTRLDQIAQWPTIISQVGIRPGPTIKGHPRSVLITGATGHLGSRLLGEFLSRSEARCHVLVRATSREAGLKRVLARLDEHGFNTVDADRISVVLGDAGQPRLGISRYDWASLILDVDTILHNAATVNMVAPFEALQAVNLVGTREIVRFQAIGRRKRLHHASTLSVFVATDRNHGRLFEHDNLDQTGWVHGGYAQTKWAAEVLVRTAAIEAGPTRIYRLGLITGDSTTGRSSPGDFLALFLRGLARLGCVPRVDADLKLDVTPVDFAARAMTHLALQPASPRTGTVTYHLANPVPLSLRELVEEMRRGGVKLEEVSGESWRSRIETIEKLDPESAAAVLALCRALPGLDDFTAFRTMDLFQATDVQFDCSNSIAALEGSGINWPVPGKDLLRRYLSAPGALP